MAQFFCVLWTKFFAEFWLNTFLKNVLRGAKDFFGEKFRTVMQVPSKRQNSFLSTPSPSWLRNMWMAPYGSPPIWGLDRILPHCARTLDPITINTLIVVPFNRAPPRTPRPQLILHILFSILKLIFGNYFLDAIGRDTEGKAAMHTLRPAGFMKWSKMASGTQFAYTEFYIKAHDCPQVVLYTNFFLPKD